MAPALLHGDVASGRFDDTVISDASRSLGKTPAPVAYKYKMQHSTQLNCQFVR